MEISHSVSSMHEYKEKRFLEKALREYHVREAQIDEIAAFEVGAAPVVVMDDVAELLRAA